MPNGGQLVVATDTTAHGVCLNLIDTAAAWTNKRCPESSKRFYSTKPGGSGLGLPTYGQIIEAHGGTITAKAKSAAARDSPSNSPRRRGWSKPKRES